MTLSIYPATRCYFIEDGVVFKINTDIKSKDSCALPVYATNEKKVKILYYSNKKWNDEMIIDDYELLKKINWEN